MVTKALIAGNCLLSLLAFPGKCGALSIQYALIPRSQNMQVTGGAPLFPSFDGDLDAILELALEKAARETDSDLSYGMPSDVPSLSPSHSPSVLPAPTLSRTVTPAPTMSPAPTNRPLLNAHACPDASTKFLLIITYQYSLETAEQATPAMVAGEGEEILQEMIGPQALQCISGDAQLASIVALDSLPRDERSTDATCSPEIDPSNECSVWEGKMRFFVGDQSKTAVATDFVLPIIRNSIESSVFLESVGTGLINAKFLGTSYQPAGSVVGSPTRQTGFNEPQMPIGAVLTVAIGGAAFLVLAGSIYYWTRSSSRRGDGHDGAATIAAGSSFNESGLTVPPQPSPFSQMLPDAYRFNENMSILSGQGGMSAIMEDEEVQSQTSSALIMSEAGYSTDAAAESDSTMSIDVPRSLYTRVTESPHLLGANKRHPDHILTMESDDSMTSDSSVDITGTPGRKTPIPTVESSREASLLDGGELGDDGYKADDSMHADEILLLC